MKQKEKTKMRVGWRVESEQPKEFNENTLMQEGKRNEEKKIKGKIKEIEKENGIKRN